MRNLLEKSKQSQRDNPHQTSKKWKVEHPSRKLNKGNRESSRERERERERESLIELCTLVGKNFVSAEESTHQKLNKDQTLFDEISNFGGKLCISRGKHPSDAQHIPDSLE
jgi:hypothetical protein